MINPIKKYLYYAALLMHPILLMVSCYPGDPITVSEADIVFTTRSNDADFSAFRTYAMPDSVVYLTDSGYTVGDDPQTDGWILDAVSRNMASAGYEKGDDADKTDAVVVVMAAKTIWVSGGCLPWYWDWWWNYPGWCLPYHYSYAGGSIFIAMFDTEANEEPDGQNPLWFAGINGLLSPEPSAERINKGIDQAFSQSSYLTAGK